MAQIMSKDNDLGYLGEPSTRLPVKCLDVERMLYAANDFLSEESRYVLFPQNGVPASNCVTTSAQIFFSGIPRLVSGWPKPFLANRAIDLPEICVPDQIGRAYGRERVCQYV